MLDSKAHAAEIARQSYGKLLSILASRSGDIFAAEDVLSEAFAQALQIWPEQGVPPNPQAWLVMVAKNRAIDVQRRKARSPVVAVEEVPDVMALSEEQSEIPDQRLALMFVCTHPAIDAGVHTPLMLQTVLGFEAADIGRSFLISPTAIAQRLVRAKRKIRDARVPFAVPSNEDLPQRIMPVLEAIYGAYAMEWLAPLPSETVNGSVGGSNLAETASSKRHDMANEAMYLAELLVQLLPNEPEVLGLAALLGFSHARRHARQVNNTFVPLHEQDIQRWDRPLIARAQGWLEAASQLKCIGRLQIEAAIAQVHIQRLHTGTTDWRAIALLTQALCRLWPTVGAQISLAASIGELQGPQAGLDALAQISIAEIKDFQPYEATRAHLLARVGDREQAITAYDRAISLTPEFHIRNWLLAQRSSLQR